MECLKYADFRFSRIQALFPWEMVIKRELKMAANGFWSNSFFYSDFDISSLLTVKQGCFEEIQIVMHQYFEIINSAIHLQIMFCFYGVFRLKPKYSLWPSWCWCLPNCMFSRVFFHMRSYYFATLTLPRTGFICMYAHRPSFAGRRERDPFHEDKLDVARIYLKYITHIHSCSNNNI